MKKIIRLINDYTNYYMGLLCHKKTTQLLFKALVSLAIGSYIVFYQASASLYNEEMTAYELKYKVEAINGNKQLENIDCETLVIGGAECNMAKHRLDTIESYTKALNSLINILLALLKCSVLLFLISFFSQPIMNE